MLAIAAAKLGWGPVRGYDHEPPAIEAAAANAAANGVELELRAHQPARGPARARPDHGRQPDRPGPHCGRTVAGVGGSRAPGSESSPTPTLVCSGLLPAELDEVAAAFAPAGLAEAERRLDGDWAALLLRAAA